MSYLNNLLQTDKVDYVIFLTPIQFILISDLLLINFLLLSLATKHSQLPFNICQEKLEPFIDKSYQELASIMFRHTTRKCK